METGSRQLSIKSKNFNATTCENNAKRVKRKFITIEHETSTIDSPSKRPYNVPSDENFPHHASDNSSDTYRDSAILHFLTKSVDSSATSAVDKVLGSSQHLSPS